MCDMGRRRDCGEAQRAFKAPKTPKSRCTRNGHWHRQLLIRGSYQTLVSVQGLTSDSPDASTAASSVRAPRGYVPRRHASALLSSAR
jgi:hypothetical protein